MQRLQAKPERSAEEGERLERLSLEFEFEKRLREMEEGGEDEELHLMRSIHQLQPQQKKKNSGGHSDVRPEEKQSQKPTQTHQNSDEKYNGSRPDENNMEANQ